MNNPANPDNILWFDKGEPSERVEQIGLEHPRVAHGAADMIPTPSYPEATQDTPGRDFWEEMTDVARCVELARSKAPFASGSGEDHPALGPRSNSMSPLSKFLQSRGLLKPYDLGMAVADDPPWYWPTKLFDYLLAKHGPPQGLLPDVGYKRFLTGPVLAHTIMSGAFLHAGFTTFALKKYFARPRPEEVAHEVAAGRMTPPDWAMRLLEASMDFDAVAADARTFTLLPDRGSPTHGAYGQGHGTNFGGTGLCLKFFWPMAAADIDRTMWGLSRGRDYLGVHYASDADAGLHVGETLAVDYVLAELARLSGESVDLDALRARLEPVRTNWLTT